MTTKKVSVKQIVKLKLYSGEAEPGGSTIGQILGQHGVNIGEFCKKFNETTKIYNSNTLLKVLVYIFNDRTFKILIKDSPITYLIRLCTLEYNLSINKPIPKKFFLKCVYEIMKKKKINELYYISDQSFCKSIVGTMISMGYTFIK